LLYSVHSGRMGAASKTTRVTVVTREQRLSSGLVVRQDYGESIRAAFYQTEFEEFLYATDGGTIFIVEYRGKSFGLTCKHIFRSFSPNQLFITEEKQGKKGGMPAPISQIAYPSSPRDAAEGSDIVDVCVIEFSDDMPKDFFKDAPYIIDEKTVATSSRGHRLEVSGVLKEKSNIDPPDIHMAYCRLEFADDGAHKSDPTLRRAIAEFAKPDFSTLTGISGAPVFNLSVNALCGMVVRGGMAGRKAIVHYIDAYDILRMLEAIRNNAPAAKYTKPAPA
jgi:hypothetical protein